MGYVSSTNGSSAVVPQLMAQGIANAGLHKTAGSTSPHGYSPSWWAYSSTNTSTDVTTAGYFTDGKDLGMALNDFLIVSGSTTYAASIHRVTAVTTTGVSLSTGTAIS